MQNFKKGELLRVLPDAPDDDFERGSLVTAVEASSEQRCGGKLIEMVVVHPDSDYPGMHRVAYRFERANTGVPW